MNLDKFVASVANKCWIREKEFKIEDQKNLFVKYHRNLTDELRGLAHNNCNLNSQKTQTSFVLRSFHIFSGYDSHLCFEHLVVMTTEKGIKIRKDEIIAKWSENFAFL